MHVPKPTMPKLASVHVSKLSGGGFKVQHVMTHGAKQTPFVFQDPSKMMKHLSRIQNSQWREPGRNEGPAIAKALNDQTY